jgi:hypothetical protein
MMDIFDEIKAELMHAQGKYAPFHSPHEGIAIIRAEYLELEREILIKPAKYNYANMHKEAIHIAAMAIRFALDIAFKETGGG